MMGFIFKCARGLAPIRCQGLFEKSSRNYVFSTRFRDSRHQYQLVDPVGIGSSPILKRSVYGLVAVWNALSVELVTAKDTKSFQKALTEEAKVQLHNGELMDDVKDLVWIHIRYGLETHEG